MAGTGQSMPSRLVSSFAHGMGRHRIRGSSGLGGQWTLPWRGLRLRPAVEYHVAVVIADPDAGFAALQPRDCSPSASQACRDNRDLHALTVGLNLLARGGFSTSVGVDLALRSVGFAHGPPLPPYNVLLAVAQAFDLSGPHVVNRVQVVERIRELPEGEILGTVLAMPAGAPQPVGAPLEGALVTAVGPPQTRVVSDSAGRFRALALPPGAVLLEVTAPGYQPARVSAQVRAGQQTAMTVQLLPRQYPVSGRLMDVSGRPVRGTVAVTGRPAGPALELSTDEQGGFATTLPAGRYDVRIRAEGMLHRGAFLDVGTLPAGSVAAGEALPDQRVDVMLRPRPTSTRVSLQDDGAVRFARPLSFVGLEGRPTAELSAESISLLDELADVALQRPVPAQIRIEALVSRASPSEQGRALAEQQARNIAQRLMAAGIQGERIQSVGMGPEDVEPGRPAPASRVAITLQDNP